MIANDDDSLNQAISSVLRTEGFSTVVAVTGREAIAKFHNHQPGLVILSARYPDMDGYELCRKIKSFNNSMVLFLTSRVEESDQLSGFAAGADEYMAKPFSPAVLVARVRSLLRRQLEEIAPVSKLKVGAVELDLESRTAVIHEQPVHLTRIEFDLLALLMEKPKRVFTRDEIIMRIWDNWHCDGHVLESHLSRIRGKFRRAGVADIAPAVRGYGYRFSTDQQLANLRN